MREFAILGSVVVMMACRGSGGAKPDSVLHDSTAISPPPTVTVTPPADSITTPRTNPADARKSPGGSKTTSGTTKPEFVPPPPPPPAAPVTANIRGIVSVVGTSRDRQVVVTSAAGGRMLVTGPLVPLIAHLAGADVWVEGASAGTSLAAERFLVKTVDGQPAIDGTLKTEGSTIYIVTSDGTRTRIVAPPPAFVGHDGARVWITGDPARGIASFGTIDPPG